MSIIPWVLEYFRVLDFKQIARPGTSQDGEDARKAWGWHNRRRPVHRSWHFTAHDILLLESKAFYTVESETCGFNGVISGPTRSVVTVITVITANITAISQLSPSLSASLYQLQSGHTGDQRKEAYSPSAQIPGTSANSGGSELVAADLQSESQTSGCFWPAFRDFRRISIFKFQQRELHLAAGWEHNNPHLDVPRGLETWASSLPKGWDGIRIKPLDFVQHVISSSFSSSFSSC